jgi:hypothetical protein
MDMAYVRWRGRCCELIATLYENGKSKKVTLANLHDFHVPEWVKEEVAAKFPGIRVDWLAVDQAIAKGPPDFLTQDTPHEHLDMATIEHFLRQWADDLSKAGRPKEAECLRAAAYTLKEERSHFFWEHNPTRRSRAARG